MSPLAFRCMAFLTGINEERPNRARIAKAVGRSERSVMRAFAELVEIGWIECLGGGHGRPSKIKVLNAVDWILACDSKMARDRDVLACDSPKMACDRDRPKSVGTTEYLELAEESQPAILSIVRENLEGRELGGFTSYTGEKLREGVRADEGTIQRIAGLLQTAENWAVFAQRAREALPRAQSWGLLVRIAEDVRNRRKPQGSAKDRHCELWIERKAGG